MSSNRVLKGFPIKCTILEIPHKPIVFHSPCDILPPFPCHVLMTVVVSPVTNMWN